MKAIVDPNLCIGCTQCAGLCPEVFSMDGTLAVDDDYTVLDNPETATNWSNVNLNII